MEEAKLNMLNASHQAVSLVDTMTTGQNKLVGAAEAPNGELANIEQLK